MPLLKRNTKISAPNYRFLNVNEVCKGGLNIHDLDYKLDITQSPNVMNMMYRNGVFGKRFGQRVFRTYANEIKNMVYYKGSLIVHCGTEIYKDNTLIASDITTKGTFFKFNKMLYYMTSNGYYQYDGTTFKEVEVYVPDVLINRKPDGSYAGDYTDDEINALGNAFNIIFNGDGTSTTYKLPDDKELLPYDDITPKVMVDTTSGEQEYTVSSFDRQTGVITLASAPPQNTNNVHITAYKSDSELKQRLLNSKYARAYGGENNSRLFIGGNGESILYYSDVFDAAYFPEPNYFTIGNSEDDVTGFGEQYDVLMVFKPNEIYSLDYYTTNEGYGAFTVKTVNSEIGCDAPNSIQNINNQLTWFHSRFGICTLVSTNIEDERNVRRIGRNIEGDNRVNGILEEPNAKECVSYDFDNKYFLCFSNGTAYVWDYYITPYFNSGKLENDAKRLAFYKFDNFYSKGFALGDNLYWFNGNNIIEKQNFFNDFGNPIHSIYETPLYEFDATDFVKSIRNIFIQCRGDVFSKIVLKYTTPEGDIVEDEELIVNPDAPIWKKFKWSEFAWSMITAAKVFRIKASIKKVQSLQIAFENNEINNDMSITNLGMEYLIVREVI